MVDSIPRYSPVIVKDASGLIDILPLEDLWQRVGSPIQVTERGEEVKNVNGLWIYYRGWKKVKRIIRHPYSGDLVRIHAVGGLVDVTPSHSIPIGKKGEKGIGYYINDPRFAKPGLHIGIAYDGRYTGGNSGTQTRLFIGSNDLAWFYGFYAAEGTRAHKEGGLIQIMNKDEKLLEKCEEVIREELHSEPTWSEGRDGVKHLTVRNKWLYRKFSEMFYTSGKQKRVPAEILNAPLEVKKAFFEGYMAGDGSRYLERHGKHFHEQVSFCTNSQTLAMGLVWMLKEMGHSYWLATRDDKPNIIQVRVNKGERNVKKPASEIVKVRTIPYSGYVYDVEVEGEPHLFATGVGPVTVHNSTTDWTVPMHYFIPNKGYVEESVFGKYWIKWYFLRFHFEAFDSGTIVVRAWARLIDHKKLDKLLEIAAPLAEMFEVTYPPPRVTPAVGGSKLIKECPICHAKLYEEDGKLIRVGSWGRSYSDHICPVFS
jgi:hypothetical protein